MRLIGRPASLCVALALCAPASGAGADCNTNGVPDDVDVQPTFGEQLVSDAANQVVPVRAADVDGDGDADVVAGLACLGGTCTGSDALVWYANTDGVGSFGPAQVVAAPVRPRALELADLDVDGDLDLLAAHGPAVSWYENTDAAGTFAAGQFAYLEGIFDLTFSIAADDVDGDGDRDLVLGLDSGLEGGSTDPVVWVENLQSHGNVSFAAPRTVDTGATIVYSAALADLDGDDDPDVVAGRYSGSKIHWYANTDGAGTFGPPSIVSSGEGAPIAVDAADLDGDGDADLLAALAIADTLVRYENLDGAGTFGPSATLATAEGSPIHVSALDLDGDGDQDVLGADVADVTGRIYWLENLDGAGSFSSERAVATVVSGINLPNVVDTADVNGDGLADVVAGLYALNRVHWYPQQNHDCNANETPDDCDVVSGGSADCNADLVPDECERDCNRNGVADACDVACPSCDADLDGCLDEVDCAPADAGAWSPPAAVTTLRLGRSAGTTELGWQAPADPGAASARYDTLRTADASAPGASLCLESDSPATQSTDPDALPPGARRYYLIRTENDCPGNPGALGPDSAGVPRSGPSCP